MEIGPTGDFPNNVLEFKERFQTDAACLEYLITLRWSGGFRCPRCGHDRAWHTARPGLRCARCEREIAVLAGTMLEGTRKPLRWWFRACGGSPPRRVVGRHPEERTQRQGVCPRDGIVELPDGVDLAA